MYKQWVESHTPEQIRVANLARTQLRTKDPLHKWRAIHDDRIPKRPSSPMFFFCKERYASGDLKGIALGDNARLLAKEWAALAPSDKKVSNPTSVYNMVLIFSDLREPGDYRQATICPRIQDRLPSRPQFRRQREGYIIVSCLCYDPRAMISVFWKICLGAWV
jgi:hypothetical protein